MASSRKVSRVQEIITRAGLIDDMQVRSANAHLDKWGGAFANVVVQLGFVDEEKVTEVIGSALKMQVMHLGTVPKDPNALAKLDAAFCEEHLVFPISLRDRVLALAMLDPTQLQIIDTVQAKYGARVQPHLASGPEILAAISKHYKNIELPPKENRARKAVSMPMAPSPSGVTGRIAALKPSSANSMLNDILGDDTADFGEAELTRLRHAMQTQEKAGQILAALRTLLREKGTLQ